MTASSQRMLASILLRNAGQPVRHPLQALSNIANTYFGVKALGRADQADNLRGLNKSMVLNQAIRAGRGLTNPDDTYTQLTQPIVKGVPIAQQPGAKIMSTPRNEWGQKIPSVPGSRQAMADVLLGAGGKYPDLMKMGMKIHPMLRDPQNYTSRPAASIQNYNFLTELIKTFPPIKQKDGTYVDSPEVARFKMERKLDEQPEKQPGVHIPFSPEVHKQRIELLGQKQALKPPPSKMLDRYFDGRDAITSGGEAIRALETALKLSPSAYEGGMADVRANIMKDWLGSGGIDVLPEGADEAAIATGRMTQKVQSQALSQLKLIFGGMPTEGERDMLLKVQGSANLPRAEREAIWRDAIALVKRRIEARRAEMNVFENMFPSYKVPSVRSSSGGKRPAHISQEIWDVMTDDEKALF